MGELAFLTSFWMMLKLPVGGQPSESHCASEQDGGRPVEAQRGCQAASRARVRFKSWIEGVSSVLSLLAHSHCQGSQACVFKTLLFY